MTCALTFEYEFSRDDDDFGWLICRLSTSDFGGTNGMWVQWQDLVEFAASLSRYPIEATNPLICEWGFREHEAYTAITKVGIAPPKSTGALEVDVWLANYNLPRHCCRSSFATDYPSLARFQHQLEQMMRREVSSATLVGAELATG